MRMTMLWRRSESDGNRRDRVRNRRTRGRKISPQLDALEDGCCSAR